MAFMGILLVAIIIFVLEYLTIISAIIFLVAGFLFLKKVHKFIAIILFVLSGLNLLMFTGWKIYTFKVDIETPDGVVKIKSSECEKYEKYAKNMDVEKVNEILEKYPALIYYKVYDNGKKLLLFYSLYHCNVDMMQCALKHGEQFNDPKLNINNDFLYRFFQNVDGNTTDEMIDTIHFALEHDAKIVSEDWNFYEEAEEWVQEDGVISPKDEELLNLIKKYL